MIYAIVGVKLSVIDTEKVISIKLFSKLNKIQVQKELFSRMSIDLTLSFFKI